VPITEERPRTDELVAAVETSRRDEPRSSLNSPNTALTIIAFCAVILLLRYMQEVFIPFVLAGLTFYALDPAVDRLQRWHIPRTVGAALMLLLLVGGVGALGYSLRDNVQAVANDLPAATRKLQALLRTRSNEPPGTMDRLQEAATQIDKTAAEAAGRQQAPPGVVRVQVEEPAVQLTEYIRWGPAGVVSLLGGLILVLFLAYFLLVTNDLFKRKLVEMSGTTLARKKITVQVLNRIAVQIEAFLKVQIFTSAVVGVTTWLALWWLGMANAAVWGLCAGLFNSIPYFGPMIVSAALAVIAFVQFGTAYKALSVAGVALLITTLEGWVLTPMLMGRVSQINTVAIFAGLLFWSWMWGIWGLLLAVPIMMCIKAVCDGVEDLQPFGKFLGD
jgi:predicted PurR-regulated permease PerM